MQTVQLEEQHVWAVDASVSKTIFVTDCFAENLVDTIDATQNFCFLFTNLFYSENI